MKIDSANIAMDSARAFTETDSKKERLLVWTGKRPDTTAANREDRVVLSLNAQPPAPKPVKSKADASDNGEITSQDGYLFLVVKAVESMTGKKLHLRRIDVGESLGGQSGPDIPPEVSRQAQQGEQGWGIEYDRTSTHYESEQTAFFANGLIKTADGKEIAFSLKLNMSREFSTTESESFRAGDAVRKVDPLVLNFDGNAADLTDAKFAFDLNQDGSTENISFVGSGSGVLVFDRNGDGVVNDGGEMFGPTSGNGFDELAALDGDKNGWIDENDAAYQNLSVWTKNENGTDTLTSLQAKDVGAIFLGNVQTPFDIKNGETLKGQITRTGIFAEEDGGVGTIQQVDLKV